MSIKYYVLVVLGISPQGFLEDLHGYILYSCVCSCNGLYVVTEIKFNSIQSFNPTRVRVLCVEEPQLGCISSGHKKIKLKKLLQLGAGTRSRFKYEIMNSALETSQSQSLTT